MSKPSGFRDELQRVAVHVDQDVGNVVKLLRGGNDPTVQSAVSGVTSPKTSDAPEKCEAIPAQRVSQSPNRTKTGFRQTETTNEQQTLENVTTRLRRDTNLRLTEAALRQKLKKQRPDTRQDIVEQAVQDWFRKHGYS